MPFDINGDLNPSVRFIWDEDVVEENKQEWVEFRVASDEDTDRLRKECGIKKKVEYRNTPRRGTERLEFMDTAESKMEKFNDAINDFAITDWCLFDKEGNEIPCTTENKLKLVNRSPKFSNWMADKLDIMRAEVEIRKEGELGN